MHGWMDGRERERRERIMKLCGQSTKHILFPEERSTI